MRMFITDLTALLIFGSSAASSLWATTYTVKPGGDGDYRTIQACANVAVAGDTCSVEPGIYNENVTAARSGSVDLPITFRAATSTKPKVRRWTLRNRSYITVTGFEITHSGMTHDGANSVDVTTTDHVRIADNSIHDTDYIAIRADSQPTDDKAKYLYIGRNTITNVAPANSGPPGYTGGRQVGISVWGDYTIVENNDISHTGDLTRINGHHNILRNNVFHDTPEAESQAHNGTPGTGDHIDGLQSMCSGTIPTPEAANYLLVEGNYHYNSPDLNQHFVIFTNINACDMSNIIVRYNTTYNMGGFFSEGPANGTIQKFKIYNNTVVAPATIAGGVGVYHTSGATVLNNIFVNAATSLTTFNGYYLKPGDPTSKGDYNLGYYTTGSKTWSAPISFEAHKVLNQDPMFVDATGDFRLQTGSPAREAGGPLTTVAVGDTGNGTRLTVADAYFFQDSWAGVNGDCISIGTVGNFACISSIDYRTNVITLRSGITRKLGDSVWLYSDSTGRRVLYGNAPNIGATFESDSRLSPMPPTSLKAISN